MKIRIYHPITIFFLFGIAVLTNIFSAQLQDKKPIWKGKIETENGVKVVKNPAEPVYGEFVFELQEDWRFGGNPNEENYYFPKGAWHLITDDEGNIYIADSGNKRIQKYDASGKFIQTIGRQGQGPGEYQFPGGVQFDAEGNIIVYDVRMAHVFTPDGKFIKRISLNAFTNFTLMTSSGFLFGVTRPSFSDKNGPKEGVVKLDPDGTHIGKIAEFRNEFSEGANVMAWHAYNYRLSLSLLDPESFIYGFSSECKIYVADAEGKTSLIIVKDEKPQPITGKEKEEIRKKGPSIAIWRSKDAKPEEGIVFADYRRYLNCTNSILS